MTRKLSGQTITIIVLAILLIFVSVCGGVYAYYSYNSNRISGYITLGNLKISMSGNSGDSGSSQIYVTNGLCVPGQSLQNSPLTIQNGSNVNIYIVVVYSLTAIDVNDPSITVDTTMQEKVIDIGNDSWMDYIYCYSNNDTDEDVQEGEETIEDMERVRCFVNLTPFKPQDESITVIEENQLRLYNKVGNEFQSKRINFTFQAYAIAQQSFSDITDFDSKTNDEKCEIIMERLHESVKFDFNI